MAFLRIRCGHCKQKWEVYERAFNDVRASECPHCGCEIDRQTWVNQVIPALCQTADANRELLKDHLDDGKFLRIPLFSFDVIDDRVYEGGEE